MNMNDIDYIVETTKELLAVPGPSGFTGACAKLLVTKLQEMGYDPEVTRKGTVLVKLSDGRAAEETGSFGSCGRDRGPVVLAAHVDTLGAMVAEIKPNGRLRLTNIGGLNANNTEGENCTVYTKDGQCYEATFQLVNASIHVNGQYNETARTFDTMEAVLDEHVGSKEDVEKLGIMAGDYVCFEPRTRVTPSGYIKSRFLDDKLSSGILLGYARYLKEKKVQPGRKVYLMFTSYEEVGHGGTASVPPDAGEFISVDMGCVGEGLGCDETMVSICAKDSMGPYDYGVVSDLVRVAKSRNLDYAVDIYPHYGSDADAALKAGYEICHGLIGPGVYASHGYERSHVDGVKNTFELLCGYLA
jgi:putative aminopeptidase FrvX